MEHVSDSELIALLGGHLGPDRAGAVFEHCAACRRCAARRDELAQTWDALGAWEVALDRDLTDRILDGAAGRSRHAVLRPGVIVKVAAAVLLAAGLGHVAGRFTASAPREKRPGTETEMARVEPEQAAAALFLEVLDGAGRPGMAGALFELSDQDEEAK